MSIEVSDSVITNIGSSNNDGTLDDVGRNLNRPPILDPPLAPLSYLHTLNPASAPICCTACNS